MICLDQLSKTKNRLKETKESTIETVLEKLIL